LIGLNDRLDFVGEDVQLIGHFVGWYFARLDLGLVCGNFLPDGV